MALHCAQLTHRAYAGWGVALDLVARERLSTILDGQRILGHPHHYLCPGEPLLGVKPEALEGEIAEVVEDTRVADREERPGEVFLLVA
jgi:hypothetical protein